MKKHILIYESIEVGLKYSLEVILISELLANFKCLASLKTYVWINFVYH